MRSLVLSLEAVGFYVRDAVDVALVVQLFLGHKHLAILRRVPIRWQRIFWTGRPGAASNPPARLALNRAVRRKGRDRA